MLECHKMVHADLTRKLKALVAEIQVLQRRSAVVDQAGDSEVEKWDRWARMMYQTS